MMKEPPSLKSVKIAREVIRFVTDYGGLNPAWRELGEKHQLRITRLAARRVEKLLAKP